MIKYPNSNATPASAPASKGPQILATLAGKVTLFENSNFCPKIQFWQNPNIFTSVSPKSFLTIFLVKSKLSTAKKSKTTTFSRVFHPKKSTIVSGNQSWIFGQKMKISNCVRVSRWGKDFSSLSRRPFLTQHESFLHARKQLIKEPRSAKNTLYFFIMTDRYIRLHLDFSSSVIHTIRKVTFLSKNSILRKPQHSFTKFLSASYIARASSDCTFLLFSRYIVLCTKIT